jgi:hypothetical protein
MANTATNLKCDDDTLGFILRELCLEDTEDNREQLGVMAEALGLYEEREKVRGALWKETGAEDCAHNLRHKSMRVAHASDEETMQAAIDDALDAVNYAGFFVRNVRAGRIQPT